LARAEDALGCAEAAALSADEAWVVPARTVGGRTERLGS
jgi:hypothetical protein